jgi:hypothetical protein
MLFHLSQLQYLYQKELSIQLLTTFGTSPLVMAPVFNILCLSLASLALVYLLHLVTTNMYLDDRRHLRRTNGCLYPCNRLQLWPASSPRHRNNHVHPSSSQPHLSPLSDIHVHPSSSQPHISPLSDIHVHPSSSQPHLSPLSDIHVHPSSSIHVSASVQTHGHR